jgi:hypothetical protein
MISEKNSILKTQKIHHFMHIEENSDKPNSSFSDKK